jgi:DNA-binding MarR family transcriptional regulator
MELAPQAELTMQQFRVLGLLSIGDARASRLAQNMALSKPTITSLTDSLVERGLVVRETDTGDRRVVSLSITAAGRAAVVSTGQKFRRVLDDIVGRCADPQSVHAALAALAPAVDAWWEERRAQQEASR